MAFVINSASRRPPAETASWVWVLSLTSAVAACPYFDRDEKRNPAYGLVSITCFRGVRGWCHFVVNANSCVVV